MPNTSNALSKEFTTILRRALHGEISIYLHTEENKTWAERMTWGGNTIFIIDGWKVIFFNDADVLDYTHFMVSPSGKKLGYRAMSNNDIDPMKSLSKSEQHQLQDLLERATWENF